MDVEQWTRFWSYTVILAQTFAIFFGPDEKKLTSSAHISNMSIKRKTSPKLIEINWQYNQGCQRGIVSITK